MCPEIGEKALLNTCQKNALRILNAPGNVFLTGVAGSGKSFLIRYFLKDKKPKVFPILASTGAAAILVGGRTFHSFFGLGIMQGGFDVTVDRALSSKKLGKRLLKAQGVIIDEISMLSGTTLRAAETISRLVRNDKSPWGGLKVIVVGDFAQLPPVNPYGREKDWAFQDSTWEKSQFTPALLKTTVRTKELDFVEILNQVRDGEVTATVTEFLNSRQHIFEEDDFDGTVLFPRRDITERYNLTQLGKIEGKEFAFETIYSGDDRFLEGMMKNSPIPQMLTLKIGALVMIRQNDPRGRWHNGSLGHIKSVSHDILKISLFEGSTAEIEKVAFTTLDAEGKEVASAINFPVNLAYAATIHKAQGMTLDRVTIDLSHLWEPGQAYVALSRAKSAKGLFITNWSPTSIKSDPVVREFNRKLWESTTESEI